MTTYTPSEEITEQGGTTGNNGESFTDTSSGDPSSRKGRKSRRSFSFRRRSTATTMNSTNHEDDDGEIVPEVPPGPPPSFKKIIWLARPEFLGLGISFLLMVAAEAFHLISPLLLASAYDVVVNPDKSNSQKMSEVNRTMLLVLLLHVVGSLAGFIRGSIMGAAGERVVARLRNNLYGSILAQEIAFFDEHKTGELVSRLGSDTTVIQHATSRGMPEVVLGFVKVCVAMGLMFWISPELAGITIGMTIIIFFLCMPFGGWIGKLAKRYQDVLGKAQTRSTEALGAMRTVQSFAAEEREKARYREVVGDPDSCRYWWPEKAISTYRVGFFKSVVGAAFFTFLFGAGFASLYSTLWYGFKLVVDGKISVGDLTAFQSYVFQIGMGLGQTSAFVAQVLEAKGASARVFQLLERVPKIPIPFSGGDDDDGGKDVEQGGGSGSTLTTWKEPIQLSSMAGDVAFQNVSFSYPSRPDMPVLRDFTLNIPSNTSAALVGSSGAGKSTVVSLLQRFYDVDGGQVTIDGQDIRSLDLKWMRQHIGYVQQEPQLFGLTIRENVCFGVERDVTDKEVETACKEANAHDFIVKFPLGYDTMVGERGVKLSGGQKQRIAIARALLVNPRILLLDEATSALDAESEHLVQEAINKAVVGRTVVIVAHRLSTIKKSRQIVVLDGHRIADVGSHDELLERCGKYQELIKRQTMNVNSSRR